MLNPLTPILIFLISAFLVNDVFHRPLDSKESLTITVIVGAVIVFGNSLAPLVPTDWLPVVSQIVTLIVVIAAALGIPTAVAAIAVKTAKVRGQQK